MEGEHTFALSRAQCLPAIDVCRLSIVDQLRMNNPTPCHSEASSIGEESASCQQRSNRFLARPAALGNDNSLGVFKLHQYAAMRSSRFVPAGQNCGASVI